MLFGALMLHKTTHTLCGPPVLQSGTLIDGGHHLNECRTTRGNWMSSKWNENQTIYNTCMSLLFSGVTKKPLSGAESDDTTEKDKALQDEIPEGSNSSSGEEEGGNSMTEEVK